MCGDLVKFVYQHVPGGELCLGFLCILFVDIILILTYKDQSQSTAGLFVRPLCNAIVMPYLLLPSFLHWPEYLSPDMHSYFLMIQLRCKIPIENIQCFRYLELQNEARTHLKNTFMFFLYWKVHNCCNMYDHAQGTL
jgi:hypothetical protein